MAKFSGWSFLKAMGQWSGIGLLLGCFWLKGTSIVEAQGERSEILQEEVQQALDLINQLKDPDYKVRRDAVAALGEIGSEEAVNPLITALQDPDYLVSGYAAEALGKIGSEAVINPLITALQLPDSGVRRYAAEALGKIGSEAAVNPLITALQDPDLWVRRAAAEALGKIGSDTAVHSLITSALQDLDGVVRSNAANALGEIGSDTAVSLLITVLKDPGEEVRRLVLEPLVLREIGLDTAVHPHMPFFQDPVAEVRSRVTNVLGEIASDTAINSLIIVLKDPDEEVRSTAAEALGEMGSEKAVSHLIIALQDPDSVVRSNAAEALGKIGLDSAVTPLITTLQDPDSKVRQSAIDALGNMGSEIAVNPLIMALQDPRPGVRHFAIEIAGRIGADAVTENNIDILVSTLENSNESIFRGHLMQILQLYPDVSSTEAFINRLNTSSETLINRYRAINSLTHQHHLQNLARSKELFKKLSDLALQEQEDRFIRYGTVLLLASLNTNKANKLLDKHQSDFLELIEDNFRVDLPYYIPEPLSSSPNPFEEPAETLIAAIDPYDPSDSSFDIFQQPIIPRIPQGETQGADPNETQQEISINFGTPVVCRFPWIAKKWNRCHS